MHFLSLGGSGRTGRLIVEEALSKGHTVTALVRSPGTFPLGPRPGLTLVEGTPFKLEDIRRAFEAVASPPAAVLVSLSLKRVSDSPFAAVSPDAPERFMQDSVGNAVAVMKESTNSSMDDDDNTRRPRLVILSQWGAGSSYDSMSFLFHAMFEYTNMKHGLAAHNALDQEMRESGVDFVLVRATLLADGDAAPVKFYGEDGKGIGFVPKVTRASVARFMIEACEKDDFVGKSPVITN